ncbi:GNAT family N-acetyltransferase [Microbacterium sp. NPDC091382]|uniref:GNAT family N-acetyltransferase n=1 Tax=Microbacterium sp. NPDC091382 TaxID=3364210 RepID=UPI00380EB56E
MEFRPLRERDLTSIPAWLAGHELRPDLWRGEHTRAAVAETDEIVAVGIMWTSRVHGDRYWVDVVVHPGHRRRGIGTAMAHHLAALRAAPLALMTRGYVDDPGLAFADALGARTIQIVPPAKTTTAARTALRAGPATIAVGSVDRAVIEAANARIYEWTHASWSPVATGFADALNEDLWDEIDPEASSVVMDSTGRVLALALVYLDGETPLLTAETTDAATPDGERLVEACILRSLDVLSDRGVVDVEFDGHVSDPHFLPVLARVKPTGRWFRLVEIPVL